MHDVKFEIVFLAINCMLTWWMKVELNTPSHEICIVCMIYCFIEKINSVCGQEVFPVVESTLVGCACPNILWDILYIWLVFVHIIHILKLDRFEVGVISWISKQSNRWLLFACLDCWPFLWVPAFAMFIIIKRYKIFVLIIISLLAIWDPRKWSYSP